ncbi:MAG: ABC transporter ATP-binding protein [Clostridia bacterium]|nr:ABC transporter ATP-binding protein [Clostridia bacterium]
MLEIKNISKFFKDKQVLNDVSLELKPSEICALLGPNGAGKSTLIKVLAGLVNPDSGEIILDGNVKKTNKDIGFMIESPAFYDNLTVEKNLTALAQFFVNVKAEDIDSVLKLVGLIPHKKVLYKNLSLGMKQRLYFAYALMGKPKILILDEPFNGIDPISIKLFEDIIKAYAEAGNIVMISGHGIKELESICTSAYIINQGKIVSHIEDIKKINLSEEFFKVVSSSGDAQ